MRKTLTLSVVVLGALLSVAAIKFFTDYPNAIPAGSDFFVFQRNQSYINASVSQVKGDWFNNPVFTGNGGIQGNWRVDGLGSIGGLLSIGGIYYGNGAGLTNVPGISGNFFAATNGVGQNPTFYGGGSFFGTYYFDEVDAQNFFPTNLFAGLTNYPVLGTDGNGQLRRADAVAVTFSNQFRVDVTHAFVASNATASAAAVFDPLHQLTNAPNAHGVFTNTATGPPSFGLLQNTELQNSGITIQGSSVPLGGSTLSAGSSPSFNGINFTNLGYGLPTNNVGGAAFVFGGPGTAATLYDTNITAATTLKLFDITACGATAGGIKIHVTCSGGTDRILTFPAGCTGAGLGTPPAVTITNGVAPKGAMFDVIYSPGAVPMTNVFWSPIF